MTTTISQLVAQIESANIPYLIRFEPGFKPSQQAINNCIAAHKPGFMNRATAEMICCSSWGAFQIMGENLYTICEMQAPISHFLIDTDRQERAFFTFIRKRNIAYSVEQLRTDESLRVRFARVYNGSAAYAAKIKEALQ